MAIKAQTIQLEIPREQYEAIKSVIQVLNDALKAADTKIKSDEQAAEADLKTADLGAKQQEGLAGFSDMLNAQDNRSLGM